MWSPYPTSFHQLQQNITWQQSHSQFQQQQQQQQQPPPQDESSTIHPLYNSSDSIQRELHQNNNMSYHYETEEYSQSHGAGPSSHHTHTPTSTGLHDTQNGYFDGLNNTNSVHTPLEQPPYSQQQQHQHHQPWFSSNNQQQHYNSSSTPLINPYPPVTGINSTNENGHSDAISRILSSTPWHENLFPFTLDVPPPAESGLHMNIRSNEKGKEKEYQGDEWKSEEFEREVSKRVWQGLEIGHRGNGIQVDVEKGKEELKIYLNEIISLLHPFIPDQNSNRIPSPPPPYLLTRFAKLSQMIHRILITLSPHVNPNLSHIFNKPFISSKSYQKKKFEDMTPAEKEMEVIKKRRDALIAKAQAATAASSTTNNNGVNQTKSSGSNTNGQNTNRDSGGGESKKARFSDIIQSESRSQSQSQSPYQQPTLPPTYSQSHDYSHTHNHHHHQHHNQHQHQHGNHHHHHHNNHDFKNQENLYNEEYSTIYDQSNQINSLSALTEASSLISPNENNQLRTNQNYSKLNEDDKILDIFNHQNISVNHNNNNNNDNNSINVESFNITRCHGCGANVTNEWMKGPDGPDSLCDLCGQHYAKLLAKKDIITPLQNSNINDFNSNSNSNSNNNWNDSEYNFNYNQNQNQNHQGQMNNNNNNQHRNEMSVSAIET
uniref:GATA-type domain-containing protein n=1 Tax=Kwoniella pini CBS 10737 TaxID=1296096 RepID=A0A1B9I981_9TREE|nr:uncharacterized protein I206_01308 [Kwoniella pini CBS 10737]OCF52024.1 hypothetical protein I206_01308 [Kwoniella pini CBS 10737]